MSAQSEINTFWKLYFWSIPLFLSLSELYRYRYRKLKSIEKYLCFASNSIQLHTLSLSFSVSNVDVDCDKRLQPVWPDWAIYWTLDNFSKPLATISLPKSPTFSGNFYKGVKILNFLVKSFLGNFDRHLAIFYRSHCLQLTSTPTLTSYVLLPPHFTDIVSALRTVCLFN